MTIHGHFAIGVDGAFEPGRGAASPWIAVQASDGPSVVRADRFVDLALEYPDIPIACLGIGRMISAIVAYFRLQGRPDYARKVFELAEMGRIHDIQLFDQLIDLARSGINTEVRPLEALAARYPADGVPGAPEDPGSPAARGSLLPEAPATLGQRLVHEACLISRIYRAQSNIATEIVELLGFPAEVVAMHGPLSIGLQGQGAIAMSFIDDSPLLVRRDAVAEAREKLERTFRTCSERLSRDARSSLCFKWSGDVVRRSNQGLPVQDVLELRTWLEETAATTPTIHNIPSIPPMSMDNKVSVVADFWGDELLMTSGVRAWVGLWVSAEGLRFLERTGGDIPRPAGVLLPRLMTRRPNVDRLRRLGLTRIIEAGPGKALIVGRLDDLALRCFAESVLGLGRQSRIANQIRDGNDLIHEWARFLYGQDRAFDVDDDEEAPGFADEAERSRRAFDDGEVGIDRSRWIELTRGLIVSLIRGHNSRLARQVLQWEYNIDVDIDEVKRCWLWLIDITNDFVYPVSEDQTFNILVDRFQCKPEELDPILGEVGNGRGMAGIRNLLMGESIVPGKFEELRRVCRSQLWLDRLAVDRGSPQLFQDLFSDLAVSNTGRVRKCVALTEARKMGHLDLADDVMKAILFGLVAAGYEPIAWAGEEFVVQVAGEADTRETIHGIKGVVLEAAQRILNAVPISCNVVSVQVW